MDANGLRFWMLSRHDDWIGADGSNTLYYCAKTNRLQLRSVSRAKPPAEEFTTAQELVEASPITLDHFGNYARWDSTSGHVVAGGSGAGEVPIYAPPPTETVNDLVMGYDGILYVAVAGSLVLVDRRGRWPDCTLSDPDFTFWRLLALPQGGVLALDRRKPQLGKVVGQPLPVGPQDAPERRHPAFVQSRQSAASFGSLPAARLRRVCGLHRHGSGQVCAALLGSCNCGQYAGKFAAVQ